MLGDQCEDSVCIQTGVERDESTPAQHRDIEALAAIAPRLKIQSASERSELTNCLSGRRSEHF